MEGRLTFLNPSAAEMLGYDVDEISAATCTSLCITATPTALRIRRKNAHRQRLHSRCLCVRDEVFWRKDGTCFPVEYVACPLVDDGASLAWSSLFRT